MKKVDMIVDLQYGSTGKGLFAGYLSNKFRYEAVVNANMPNAGHTFIDSLGNKFIQKVLPSGIASPHCKYALVGPGSVFSVEQLLKEITALEECGYVIPQILIHENAVVLRPEHKDAEAHLDGIGSTKQGSAAAMMEKIARSTSNPPIVRFREEPWGHPKIATCDGSDWLSFLYRNDISILAEGAQGYSLGINGRFYPYCTSRDCTPAKFMADMGIPLKFLDKVYGTARTLPIRVGGNSGGYYPDQIEVTWEYLGLEPELTTVTKKIRRIFTFSRLQILEAIGACQPDEVFLNFCNYISNPAVDDIITHIEEGTKAIGCGTYVTYLGYGSGVDDILQRSAPQ